MSEPGAHRAPAHPGRRRGPAHGVRAWWDRVSGGPARGRAILLLGCVLGLDQADLGSVGALAGKLEHALGLSNTQLGLLAAAPAIATVALILPMGLLVDRGSRVRLLWVTMLAWAAVQVLSGTSSSFEMLFLVRLGLGAASAAALPAVASLVGDLFPSGERGRIWGLILSGELVGSAFGYLVAGEAATLGAGSWRTAFFVLAGPSLIGALALRRWLPEPARGGRGWLAPGARRFLTRGSGEAEDPVPQSAAQQEAARQHVGPNPALVLHRDPATMSLWRASVYVLRIRTNLVLIIASALGYFYFTAVTTFGLVYFEGRYHVSQGPATLLLMLLALGGLAGVVMGGGLADRWLGQGRVNSRIVVAGASFALAAVFFLPGLLSASVGISLPLFILAGLAFGARNPALDAARLDIMHHRLWGRAESIRSLLRRIMTASAPIVFGALADALAPTQGHRRAADIQGFGSGANVIGLRLAFLLLLAALVLGGVLTFLAMRTYPRDVATARASEMQTAAQPRGAQALSRAA